jgi:hypothetical protein
MNAFSLISLPSLLATLGVSVLLGSSLDAAETFNPAAEFSGNNNPNGPWTYGYSLTLGDSLIPHRTSLPPIVSSTGGLAVWRTDLGSGVPAVWYNPISLKVNFGTLVLAPGELVLHPGPNNEFGLLRFSAPIDGTYNIAGSFSGNDNRGASTDVHILANGESIFSGAVNGFGPGSGPSFNLTVPLKLGDSIDFAVGTGQNGFANDGTGLATDITLISGVFDAASDFSASANPSGSWTYGYRDDFNSPFVPFDSPIVRGGTATFWTVGAIGVDPSIGYNPDSIVRSVETFLVAPRSLVFHPGPNGQNADLRWTAPEAGTYLLDSHFVGLGAISTVDLHVVHNNKSLFEDEINGRTKRSSYVSLLSVASGDLIDVEVGWGGDADYSFDSIGLDVQFRPIKPSSSPALAIANAVQLSWPAPVQKVFQLQSSSTIQSATWENVGSPITGLGGSTNLFELTGGQSAKFYRILAFE